MTLSHGRSCFGVARVALAAFLLGVGLVYLFGGLESGRQKRAEPLPGKGAIAAQESRVQ